MWIDKIACKYPLHTCVHVCIHKYNMNNMCILDCVLDVKINKNQLCQLVLMLNAFLAIDNQYLIGLYRYWRIYIHVNTHI